MSDLRIVIREFIHAVSAANLAHRKRGEGGQQVPFHGDFASAPPSTMIRLTRWARDMERALDDDTFRRSQEDEGGEVTKKQRAQVVELLRCAADRVGDTAIPLTQSWQWFTGDLSPYSCPLWTAARDARIVVELEWHRLIPTHADMCGMYLEAAQRVEEGSWP